MGKFVHAGILSCELRKDVASVAREAASEKSGCQEGRVNSINLLIDFRLAGHASVYRPAGNRVAVIWPKTRQGRIDMYSCGL